MTYFSGSDGVALLEDFMPMDGAAGAIQAHGIGHGLGLQPGHPSRRPAHRDAMESHPRPVTRSWRRSRTQFRGGWRVWQTPWPTSGSGRSSVATSDPQARLSTSCSVRSSDLGESCRFSEVRYCPCYSTLHLDALPAGVS